MDSVTLYKNLHNTYYGTSSFYIAEAPMSSRVLLVTENAFVEHLKNNLIFLGKKILGFFSEFWCRFCVS